MRARVHLVGLGAAALCVGLVGCFASESDGFVINGPGCFAFGESGLAIVQMPMTVDPTLKFDPAVLDVELREPESLEVVGFSVDRADKDPLSESAPPSATDILQMDGRDDDGYFHVLDAQVDYRLVVLLSAGEEADGRADGLTIKWGGGEPIYLQSLDLDLKVDDECTI